MTRRTVVQTGAEAHVLATDQDVLALKDRLADAARSGGAFVALTLAGGRVLDVLVTPGLYVAVESQIVDTSVGEGSLGEWPLSLADDFSDAYPV